MNNLTHTQPRIIHGHVDAGIMRLPDMNIGAVRFDRRGMPIETHRAVLIILPEPPGADTLLEFVGQIALENEQLKKQVASLEESCQQMASDLVTSMDDPDYGSRAIGDDAYNDRSE
jgi:hypothetical protein